MNIKLISDDSFKNEWNKFVAENSSPSSFLQTWEWGLFKIQNLNNRTQKNIFRYAVYNDSELIAVAQFLKVGLPGGNYYLNCPRGPIIKGQETKDKRQGVFELIINEIKKNSKQEKIVFVRIAPADVTPTFKSDWSELKLGVTKPKILTNLKEPDTTLILNLEKNEEELLVGMHHKTRYNIHVAERKEIKIKISSADTEQDVDAFYNLFQQTAQRDKINILNKEYYQKLLKIAGNGLQTALFVAEHNTTPLAAIIIIGFGDTATYVFGASANEQRDLMPNYLIQWSAINWVKQQNYKYYDFWGISQTNKKWQGITRFKQGFVNENTGQEINYLGSFDYVLNKTWYNLYRIAKIFKK